MISPILSNLSLIYMASLLSYGRSQSLPYNSAHILLSSENSDVAYILQPSGNSAEFELLSLNISSTLTASDLAFSTITPALPFHGTDAFIPVINDKAEISVYAGNCSSSTASSLWTYIPDSTSPNKNGTWTQGPTSTANDVTALDLPGADFLASGLSFSSSVGANASDCDIFIFGGMCPSNASTTVETWQASATYSNHMLKLTPSGTSFTIDLSASRGPPIPEAGFSITGLQATKSNSSTGVVTQQQNFVLLGGHTETAFINMSQAAIFSLPEESWSFIDIEDPSVSNTELTVKDTSTSTSVDSRSGHTSVLTEDGSKVLVLGGWVGDITTAANPQFAVLEVEAGYGGSGDWVWDIPTLGGNGIANGTGIYGHGAAMLPGNIMMVVGGYTIPSASSKAKRSSSNSQTYFFNATSMSWTDTYINPSYLSPSDTKTPTGSSSSKARQVGLGTGLGLGFAAVAGAVFFYLCYSRKLKRERHARREKQLQDLSLGAARYYPAAHDAELGYIPMGQQADTQYGLNDGYQSIPSNYGNRGGSLDIDRSTSMPVLNQGGRRNMHSSGTKGAYQAAPLFDGHTRANSLGTAGPIHPIYETDEEEISFIEPEVSNEPRNEPRNEQNSRGAPVSSSIKRKPVNLSSNDPFQDPPQISRPVESPTTERSASTPSPEMVKEQARDREKEIESWVADWAAADALLNSQVQQASVGRISPTKKGSQAVSTDDSGRTDSNLSERSTTTAIVSRSMSQRSNSLSAFFTGGSKHIFSASSSTAVSPTYENPGGRGYAYPNFGPSTAPSFPGLIIEGETLLPRPGTADDSASPSKLRRGGKGNWLVGSIRRALGGEGSPTRINRSPSFSSRETSPTRPLMSNYATPANQPRRTVSAGAAMWRRKQGKSDWEDSEILEKRRGSMVGATGRENDCVRGGVGIAGTTEDEEWDIERAIENRVVQVMFTVPKERLRVVNADEAASDDDEDTDEKTGVSEGDQVGMKEPQAVEHKITTQPESNSELEIEPEPQPELLLDIQQEQDLQQKNKQVDRELPQLKIPRVRSRGVSQTSRQAERELLRELGEDTTDSEASSLKSALSTGSQIINAPRRPKSRVAEMVERLEAASAGSSPTLR